MGRLLSGEIPPGGKCDINGDVRQGDGTAAPSARAAVGELVLGEQLQRGRHCRR